MAKSVRANLQLASENDVRTICAKDAREVSSQPDKYVKANLLSYYVLTNTWLLMIKQWSEYGWIYVFSYVKEHGLFSLIREFDNTAGQLIHGDDITFSIARQIYSDVKVRCPILGVPFDDTRTIMSNPMSAMLMLLRYGKRFSPLEADKLRDASLKEFIERQKTLKYAQRQPKNPYIIGLIRDAIQSLLDWDALCEDLSSVDLTDIVFTPGVSFDTRADLVSKLRFVAKERVEYFPLPFGIPMLAHKEAKGTQYWGKYSSFEYHPVRIAAVPKNYKTARVIAPEDVVRQAFARRYFIIMDRYCPGEVKLHDQTQNQQMALLGSKDGSLATLDLSAASDSITWTLISSVFPTKILRFFSAVLPTHFVHEGTERLLQSAATMGNSITFWLESILFLGISKAAVDFYNRHANEEDDTISCYGDDIIVPTNAAQTVIDFLEYCDFTVNVDKSFYDRELRYRESCGEEYYEGINVSSVFFPRFPLEGELGGKVSSRYFRDSFTGTRVDTLTALVDLQHKMFHLCVPAALLLAEIVREAEPRMTQSTPEEGYMDLWAYESTPRISLPPNAFPKQDEKSREWLRQNGIVREAHLGPIYVAKKLQPGSYNEDDLLLHLYRYQEFLKHGPRYDNDLDALLGVTAEPLSLAAARLDGEIRWVYIK